MAKKDYSRVESKGEGEAHVERLISKMILDEKIGQMAGKSLINGLVQLLGYGKYAPFKTPAVKRLGLPGIRFIDGPRGVNFKGSTAFPVSMARGATWDTELEERVGEAMGYEARAGGANLCGAVCINVLRHPSWGRSQETFGEDPYHIGRMGSSLVKGLQRHVMACAKHFAANSIEESRFFVDIHMDERVLREVYLPHFKMCVDAGVCAVMTAYNKLNGEYCGHNRHLIREILKGDWGFQGFVISDFLYGIRNTEHAVNAGLDIEMPYVIHFGRKLKKAVQQGKIPGSAIDETVRRILRQQLRFPHLEDKKSYAKERVGGPEHAWLAREVAQKGIVLLKNANSTLPLDRKEVRRIAVVGRFADTVNLGDRGSSAVRPPYAVTPLMGIKDHAGSMVEVLYDSGRRLSRVRSIAEKADAVIVVAGLTWKDEGEFIRELCIGGDRISLDLKERDLRLINAMTEVNNRCIVVLEGGGAITMEPWIKRVQAVLMTWYPGMEGGNALADILYGDVNPSGKLPITFPRSVNQLFRFDNRARQVEYNLYHGYRYFDKLGYKALFPFGFGLSYTTYKYNNLRLSKKSIKEDGELDVTFEVTNTGDMGGEEIVELYLGFESSTIDRPKKELRGFSRLSLEPGETKELTMKVRSIDTAYWDNDSGAWAIEPGDYRVYVGSSSRREDLHLSDTFRVE